MPGVLIMRRTAAHPRVGLERPLFLAWSKEPKIHGVVAPAHDEPLQFRVDHCSVRGASWRHASSENTRTETPLLMASHGQEEQESGQAGIT